MESAKYLSCDISKETTSHAIEFQSIELNYIQKVYEGQDKNGENRLAVNSTFLRLKWCYVSSGQQKAYTVEN